MPERETKQRHRERPERPTLQSTEMRVELRLNFIFIFLLSLYLFILFMWEF